MARTERRRGKRFCPSDQVVVGFDGNSNGYFSQLALICAPLAVTIGTGAYALQIGATTELPPVGGAGTPAPTTHCPAGQIARGDPLRSGQWVDAFSLACATPRLTYSLGTPCSTGSDCATGVCAATCAASTCTPPSGCACERFEGRDYVFCKGPITYAAAQTACVGAGMNLTRVDTAPEEGWLRATGNLHGLADAWIGGDSLVNANEWRWVDGTLFWTGGPTGSAPTGVYTNWSPNTGEPRVSPGCAYLIGYGRWGAQLSTAQIDYACKK